MEFLLRLLKISAIAGAVTALLCLLGPVLRRRYHAKWRYWVWLCLAVLLLSPLVPLPELEGAGMYTAPVQVEVPAMAVTYGEAGLSLAPQGSTLEALPPVEESFEMAPAESSAVVTPPVEEVRTVPLETILLILWGLGTAGCLLWTALTTALFSWRCMRWARRPDAETAAALAAEKALLGFAKPVDFYVTSAAGSPVAMGLFQRKIFLPEGAYGEERLRFVLRHELVHLKRRDLWFQLLLCTARAVHWFSPLVWLLVRQARADMELTCDDAALSGAGQGERRAYSEALLATLHRQRSGVLTTHFYGGKELMKERFRNILTGPGRRRGTVVLCMALVLTAAAMGAVACTALKPEPLTEEELAMWQERVESEEWYGFFVSCYSDVDHLDLDDVFRYGAGLAPEVTDPAERSEALTVTGELSMGQTLRRMTRADMDAFLQERTGLGLEDLFHTWDNIPATVDGEVYYIAPITTGTPYMGSAPQVTGGERMGDTVTLTLDLTGTGYYGHGGGMERADMTLEGDRVVSFTNEVFDAVEQAAEEHLQDTAGALTALGLTVEQQEMGQPYLRGWDREDYTLWSLTEKFRIREETETALALLGENWYSEGGWLCIKPAFGEQLIAKREADGVSVTAVGQEEMSGWSSFGAYVRYALDDGMISRPELYWPQDLAMLIGDCVNTGQDWIFQRDEVARQYVEALGDEAASITVLEDDLTGTGPVGTVALLEVETAGGKQLRLLIQEASADTVNPNFAPERYWQVVGFQAEDALYSDIPLPIFYDWLPPEEQAMYWQLSRSWYQVERKAEAADFALQNGVVMGMTVEEVAQCLGGTPDPYSTYLHMGGSIGFTYEQVDYSFYHTPEGEQLVSLRLPANAAMTAASTGFGPGSTVSDVLAALGYPDHPLRGWAEDILYGDLSPDGRTDRFAYLSYTTILGRYTIYRQEGAVSLQYHFSGDNTLDCIDLFLDSQRFLGTLGAPIPPAGVEPAQ